MAKKTSPPAANSAVGFIKAHQKCFIGTAVLLIAAVLLLIIINPANSPTAVFDRYLDCLRSENDEQFAAISYDANFSKTDTADAILGAYRSRFASGGDLLGESSVRITIAETPDKSDFVNQRSTLAEGYRNAQRITDIRNLTFKIKTGETESVGTAKLICVTGKWYIGEVTGI